MVNLKHIIFCREAILDATGLMTMTGFTGGSAVALPSVGILDMLTVVMGFEDMPKYNGVFSVSYGVAADAVHAALTIGEAKDLSITAPGGGHTIVHKISGFQVPRFGRYWFRIEIPTVGIWIQTLDIVQRTGATTLLDVSQKTTMVN